MKDIKELLKSLNREWNHLDASLERLNNFMLTDEFEDLPPVTKINIQAQASVMASYSHILRARMAEYGFKPSYQPSYYQPSYDKLEVL